MSRRRAQTARMWGTCIRLVVTLLAALVAFGVTLSGLSRAEAQAPLKIRVRGAGRLEARASRADGEALLYGALTDDAGRPLPAETVSVHVKRESDPQNARTAESMRLARGCDSGGDPALPGSARGAPTAYGVRVTGPTDDPEVLLVTDEDGRFCFRAKLDPERYAAELVWKGRSLVEPAQLRLSFDTSRQALALRFDPTPRVVLLDAPRSAFEVVALLDENGSPSVAPTLAVTLATESGASLGSETTDRSGRARFAPESTKLGPPGRGELRAAFAGNADVAFASQVVEIERHVKVSVRVPLAESSGLEKKVPDDGIPLAVDVTSVAGPVPEGMIEARIGDVVVGAAPVEKGLAKLVVTFTAQGDEAPVQLRYVPLSPWYEPLGETVVRVPIRGPGILAKAPVLVTGIAVLAFFLLGRVTSSARKTKPAPDKKAAAVAREGKARVEVVRVAARGERGWTGRLLDAHEGTPIAGARVWVERGSFEGRSVLATTTTNDDGRFALEEPPGGLSSGEMLGAESRLHTRHVQPLPGAGELSISLVLRRRALLARMVSWARRAGGAFDVKPEPTPGHVKRAAGADFRTARWADEVERAVFGGAEIDARAEADIDRLAPGGPEPQPGNTPEQGTPEPKASRPDLGEGRS
jgi:hypothetical protein